MTGDQPVWLTAKSRFHLPQRRTRECNIERTFVPVSGRAYILRISHKPGDCQVELFRIVPGADPVREKMQRPEPESCLIAPHIASSSSGK